MWSGDRPPRPLKPTQHLVPSLSGDIKWNRCLFRFRCVAAGILILESLYTIVDNFILYHMVQLQYLTLEGLFLTTATFCCLVAGHYRYKETDLDDYRCSHWWKWNSFLFQMSLLWQVIISVCFWGFLVPTGNFVSYTGTTNHIIKYSADHSIPCILMCIDWSLNSIGFEYS